jgi:chlorophyll synthase
MQVQTRSALPSAAVLLEYLKPITWFAPMWAFSCGVVSGGPTLSGRWPSIAIGVLLCGPLVCAMSQAVNDWYDRDVDSINEPGRPIPSGRMPGRSGLYVAYLWTSMSVCVAASLGPFVLGASLVGIALAWAYSAPPFRLKQNGWWGNSAVAFCYEGLPWLTGAAIISGAFPDTRILAFALLYSVGAHGIMTLNDFKAVEGDRRMGIRSLPVQLGTKAAAQLACLVMALPQAIVIAVLVVWGRPLEATAIGVLLAAQAVLMVRLLSDPLGRAAWYNATGTSLYVLGMLVSAFALRAQVGGAL